MFLCDIPLKVFDIFRKRWLPLAETIGLKGGLYKGGVRYVALYTERYELVWSEGVEVQLSDPD